MPSRWLPTVVLVVLVLGGCVGPWREADPVTPTQYNIFGTLGSGYIGLPGSANGTRVLPWESCLFTDVNDARNIGRISTMGWVGDETSISMDFELFNATDASQDGGVRRDFLDAYQGTNWIPFPAVRAALGAWGNTTFEINAEDYRDLVTSDYNWTAHFVYLEDGVRDDEDHTIKTADGQRVFSPAAPQDVATIKGDREAHLLIMAGPGDTSRIGDPVVLRNEDETGAGLITSRAYAADHYFNNSAYGSYATLTFRVQGAGPTLLGTRLTFNLITPSGKGLANLTLGNVPVGADQRAVTVPMDELHRYFVRVRGEAYGASYTVRVQHHSPDPMVLDFWWEDVRVGPEWRDESEGCRSYLGAREPFVPMQVDSSLPTPPGIRLEIVLVGIAGTIVAGLFLVKLVLDTARGAEFRKKLRR